jgi:hypothetical protein
MYPAPQYSETERFACTGEVYPHHNLRFGKLALCLLEKSNTPEGRSPERSEGEKMLGANDPKGLLDFECLRC